MRRSVAIRVALSFSILSVAVVFAALRGAQDLFSLAGSVSPSIYAAIIVSLIFNAITAAARFSFISAQVGGACQFRSAVAIVSASNIAGALFFQIAGQLAARGALMAQSGNGSFANAVVITAYERLSAALVSAIGAVVGAYIVFGRLYFDWGNGAQFVKLAVVGGAALVTGLFLSGAARSILPRLSRKTAKLWGGAFVFSASVQLPVMVAYMLAAHSLAPNIPALSLFGATLVVMFAASIPISFAGWGVRELSAVVALGAIGLDPAQAVLTAVIVGLGSMLAAGICAAITLPATMADRPSFAVAIERTDYAAWLALAVPVAVAIAVPFQVYLPISGSIVNANLADPLALIGAALFVLRQVSARRFPVWRHKFLGVAVAVMTGIIVLSLLIGFAHFGVTTWALMNRFVGWFLLLAYVATGALVVSVHGERGIFYVAGGFVGAVAAIGGAELLLVAAGYFVSLPADIIELTSIKGFAQNRNAFAFQLVAALCLTLVLFDRRTTALVIASVIIGVITLTFSRSGIATAAVVMCAAALLNPTYRRWLPVVGAIAVALAIAIYTVAGPYSVTNRLTSWAAGSYAERMETLKGGLRLFLENPLFGAGLGAYRNLGNPAWNGEPLVIHSAYVWLLAETGLAGFLAFVVPAVAVLWSEIREAKISRIAAAAALCIVAMAMMNIPADMLYQRAFWLLMGAFMIASRASRSGNEPFFSGATSRRALGMATVF